MTRADNDLEVICLADVGPQRVTWLWKGRLPLGKLVVLDGDPDAGKSAVSLDIASRISTGSPMPDGQPIDEAANEILMSAEDGIDDTIRPRVDVAGGNPERFKVFSGVWQFVGEEREEYRLRPPVIPGDLGHLRALILEHRAQLVVVDVLNAFLSAKVDSHRDQDVRGALMPLARIAEETGCCILVIRHLNKTGGSNPLYRGGGSIGVIGAARVGLMAGADPDDETRSVLAVSKCNIAAKAESLAYRLVVDDEHDCVRVQWEGAVSHKAADLVANRTGDDDDSTDAGSVLAAILSDGPIRANDGFDRMAEAGFSKDQTKRAKRKIRVTTDKIGKPGDTDQSWWWSLPSQRRAHEESEECSIPNPTPFAPLALPSQNGHGP